MDQSSPLAYTTVDLYTKFPPDIYGEVVAERTFKACSNAKIQSPKVLGNLCNESDPQNMGPLTNVPPSYASLRRLGKLPKMQKLRRIANKDIQKIAQNVADGKYDCTVTFCRGFNDVGRLYFYIYFNEEDNKKLAKPKEKDVKYDFRVTVVLREVHDNLHASSHEVVIGCETPYMMEGSLNSEQKTDIYYRLIHQIFRTHGMDIYNMGLDHIFIKKVIQLIGLHWTRKRDGQLAEDAYFTGIDILARLDQNWDSIKFLLHSLGEAYEANEQLKKAGDIYSATMNFYNKSFTIEDSRTFQYNAGLAYRNCDELALAESSFILALYYCFTFEAGISIYLCPTLKSMYIMYQKMDVEKRTTGFQLIRPIVGALITAAGLNTNDHVGGTPNRDMAESNFEMILQPCYRNKSAAYNRIKALVAVPTITSFRKQLYDSCDQNTVFAFREERNKNFVNESASSIAAERMRDELRPRTGYDKSFGKNRATPYCCEVCKLPEEFKTGGKLLQCSLCKNVYYCSKACQKDHWKFHKQFCLGALNKKKKTEKKDARDDEEEKVREKLSNVSIDYTKFTPLYHEMNKLFKEDEEEKASEELSNISLNNAAATGGADQYYEDFFRYAYHYGEVAARKTYGAWSPPEGTSNPYGVNPNPAAVPAATPASAAADVKDSSARKGVSATGGADRFYEDFFRYAYYYGEEAARKTYGAWSPPEGTSNPYGVNPNLAAAAAATLASASADVKDSGVSNLPGWMTEFAVDILKTKK